MAQEILLSPQTSGERLKKLLQAEEMDPIVLATANLYLQQKSVQDIASELNIREDRVAQILDREEVQIYLRETLLSQGFLNPFKRMKLIDGVIESLVAKGLADESMSNKDLLDWLVEARKIATDLKPKKATPGVAVQINNNLDKLTKDIS